MLKRKISDKIINYCINGSDKILCVNGARQVGKSFIIREICSNKKYFDNYIELNMANDFNGEKLFANIKTTEDFYIQVSVNYGDKLIENKKTIIFIDEIQVYPHLLTLLKPLNLENKFRYICSGSQLGIALSKTTLIPMGSIMELKMYPLDFEEFLWANNVGEIVIKKLKECYKKRMPLEESLHNKILSLFKIYLYVGGMPSAVQSFVSNKNITFVSDIHNEIIKYYREDASKYDKENKLKIKTVYDFIPSNLENKVKRIEYTNIEKIKDARYKRYQNEFDYLIESGIVNESKAVSEPKFPLIQSSTKTLIKLYFNDVGLLSQSLYKNNINAIINNESNKINLGAVYETVVAQELKSHDHKLYYYDRRKEGEVDFLVDDFESLTVLPLEIKSGKEPSNFRALPKLLKSPTYNFKEGIVLSNLKDIKIDNKIIYLPIYFVMFI